MVCASCGVQVDATARFCPNCGAAQAVTIDDEERRVVTVLFADIVGFTGLAENRDPEEVKHLIDRAFTRLASDIAAFGGVVDKVLGDGIIALFGAPVAHEDDAERAVRAGLQMQRTMLALSQELDPPLELRVGINTGEVLVGTTSPGGGYTAMGDVVNSADRLQSLAAPGETLVGDPTRLATGDSITYRPMGELPARGREEPLLAWVALGAVRPPGSHPQRSDVFVGRRHEIDLLEAQARLAVDGQRAQLSVVFGEAGMGKTRLVNEVASRLESQFGATVIDGRCLPYGEANVWWPVADLVRDLFDLTVDAPRAEGEATLSKALSVHLPAAPSDEIDRYTTALLHALGYDTELRGGDRSRNRSEVMLAFTTVLEAELAQRPVVVVLSDLHWAARVVWELIRHLLNELARTELVMLTTARATAEEQLPQGPYGLSVIRLGPLSDCESAELLGELGIDLSDGGEAELVDRSGGNPYFLEELALLVTNDAGPSPDDVEGADDGAGPGRGALPATLRGIVAARLDALDPGERRLLEDAAVLGRNAPLAGLRTMVHQTRGIDDIEADLAGLVEKDLLEVSGNRYSFCSHLVRDVTYSRLTKTGRAQQHLGIAHYMEAQQSGEVRNSVAVAIAEHYRAAAQLSLEVSEVPGLDRRQVLERALYWLEQAGERALDVGAPFDAARWFESGIELADGTDIEARFVLGRARARTEVRDIPGGRADLDRLDGYNALDPITLARAVLTRGDLDRKAGDLDPAAARLREAADRMSVLGVPDQQALALRLLGMTELARADDTLARQALEGSRQVAMEAGDRRSDAWALQSLAWFAFQTGRVLEARRLVGEAADMFAEIGDRGGLVWTRGISAWVAFHTGDWDAARHLIDEVLPETRRRGDAWAESIMLNLDASLQLWSGNAAAAVELARQAGAVADGLDDVGLMVEARAVEGRALVTLGQLDDASEILTEAYSLADQAENREGRRVAVIANAASAARLGEPDRAIRWAARYDSSLDDRSVVGETDLIVSLAAATLQRGSVPEAASQLQWVDAGDSEQFGKYAAAVRAIVAAAQGRGDEVEALVSQVMDGPSTYLDKVFALLARAAMSCRRGDGAATGTALTAARTVLDETDDEPTRLLVSLVAAICGFESVEEAAQRMRRVGLDPTGWARAFTLASNAGASGAIDRLASDGDLPLS